MKRRPGLKTLRLDSLRFDVNIVKLADDPEVDLLAGSIKAGLMINPPLVRASDRAVICGRRRCAAARILGQKEIEVQLCDDVSDEEADRLRIDENLRRQHFSQAERIALADRIKTRTKAIESNSDRSEKVQVPKKTGHRKLSPEREAMREEATKLGVTERAIEKQVAKVKEEPAAYGVIPPRGRTLQAGLQEVEQKLRACQSILARLDATEGLTEAEQDMLSALHRFCHHAANQVRQSMPDKVCMYCKAIPRVQKTCAACRGLGWMTRTEGGSAPKELLAGNGEVMVMSHGKIVAAASVTQ